MRRCAPECLGWIEGDCRDRVVRGGSWWTELSSVRSVTSGRNTTTNRRNGLGFRVARSLSAGAGASTAVSDVR
jgi:formylglycine-generating enzyme required for sulfatase activity